MSETDRHGLYVFTGASIDDVLRQSRAFFAAQDEEGFDTMYDQKRIDDVFRYHAPFGDQAARYIRIRDKAKELAELILEITPTCPEQTIAINNLRFGVVMIANAAIACNESPPPAPSADRDPVGPTNRDTP